MLDGIEGMDWYLFMAIKCSIILGFWAEFVLVLKFFFLVTS